MGTERALKATDQERRGINKEENSHPGAPGLRSTTDYEGNSYFLGNLVANPAERDPEPCRTQYIEHQPLMLQTLLKIQEAYGL